MTHLLDTAVPSTCAAPMSHNFIQPSVTVPTLITVDPLHHTNLPQVTPAVTSSLTGVHTPVTSTVSDGQNSNLPLTISQS